MELPANLMTPTAFCERIKKEAEGLENVEVIIRDEGQSRANLSQFDCITHYSYSLGC